VLKEPGRIRRLVSKGECENDRNNDPGNRSEIGHFICHFESRKNGVALVDFHEVVLFGSNNERNVPTSALEHSLSETTTESGETRRGEKRTQNAFQRNVIGGDDPDVSPAVPISDFSAGDKVSAR
jgi:hypothetical protein